MKEQLCVLRTLVPSPPKKNLILSAVRLRRAVFLRGFCAAGGGGGASGSSYFKYSAQKTEIPALRQVFCFCAGHSHVPQLRDGEPGSRANYATAEFDP